MFLFISKFSFWLISSNFKPYTFLHINMSSKICVIGSNSFTGATFVRHCLEQGLEVLGLSRSPEPDACFLPYRWLANDLPNQFHFTKLDLNEDLNRLPDVLDGFRPDYVVNFAAQSMVAESWTHPEHWYQTNVVSNVLLHDILRRMDFIQKYVHVSTPEVYGSCSGLVSEDAPFNPSTPYAASRAACDLHLMTYFRHWNFPVVFTRAANVYGPGQQLYRIIPRTILCAKTGERLQLHGGGHSVRSFIHGSDVARATLLAAKCGEPGEAYHLSTSDNISIADLVSQICQKMGVNFSDIVQVVGERAGKDAAYLLSSAKAHAKFGWRDQISLENGLEETIAWVETHFHDLQRQPQSYVHKR